MVIVLAVVTVAFGAVMIALCAIALSSRISRVTECQIDADRLEPALENPLHAS